MSPVADATRAEAPAFTAVEYRPSLNLLVWPAPGRLRATVLFFHGGGWFAGSAGQFEPQCTIVAHHGIRGISAEYRVHTRHGTMVRDAVEDACAAAGFVAANLAPTKLFLAGASAGGLLAIHAARQPNIAAAGLILYNPVLDLSAEGFRSKAVPPGGDISLSPLHIGTANLPPLLLMHGKSDQVIDVSSARRYAREVTDSGAHARLLEFAGGHGFFNLPQHLAPTTAAMIEFINAQERT